ncbi:histone-lysine N-methyltransferase SUVR5-like [Phragmites australis]|uniref:histone-lysine N-methyltransferase SUVR5-like n=1 Tax=Phragmites australis TaxID=29695 RepID=UPI002D7906DD|nr:histone-lysine N-methyltransferase SUVR5-like [Phragmites australis]
MLMDPPVMQVDCQLQNDVEKTSSIGYDKNHTLSHDDYGWTGSDVHPTNDAIICNPVLVNNASQTGIDVVFGTSSENSPVNLDDLPQGAELRKANNSDNSCSNALRCQLNVSTGNNGSHSEDRNFNKQSFSKEDVHHPHEEIYPPPHPGTVSLLRSGKSNGDALPSQEEMITEECAKVDDIAGAASKEVETDLLGCHAAQKELQCTLQDLSEVACSIDLVHNKSSPQEENESCVSPINDMDQIVNNNSCNGDTNYKVGELGAGNARDEDRAVALWVKWRGKWQTGIRCCRVDCPLPTLKAKPTHDRKSYIVVFFPRTRTYSWVDMLLILPIEEYPLPLVNGTHRKWRKLVKDLSVPRRFIMQKLAISMLNFSDELHIEAVIVNARKATTWKEFALEASFCKDYTDLGKMLVKLQNMILPDYISCQWLQNSFDLWNQKCKNARDAETIEILYEELRQSVLWNKVDELWNASVQPELVREWKTWKQEVMKQFFSSHSHPAGNAGKFEKNNCYDDPAIDRQISRKRPKLEVRRGETQISHMGDTNCRTPREDPNRNNLPSNSFMPETIGALDSRNQNNPLSFPSNSGGQEIPESGSANPALQNVRLELDSFKSSRQCSAYIEAKGRQCGRWANDGDIYCCVHQSMHFTDHSSREDKALTVETPLCSGMTNMGRKCKHRAQYGSIFCKKHCFQTNLDTMHPENLLSSSVVPHKREESPNKQIEEISNSHAIYNIGVERDWNSQVSVQLKSMPTVAAKISGEKTRVMENTDQCTASTSMANTDLDSPLCIGIRSHDNIVECQDYAKRHTLYCEKHLPKFLKRARDGKSRLISKDVFINILKDCTSRKDKICLHQACEFLFWFLRNNLSHQRSGLGSDHMPQILAEVSKNPDVGEFLLKLISTEREKLENLWGFGTNGSKQIYSENQEGSMELLKEEGVSPSSGLKCKICAHEFADDQALGLHWTKVHRKEARWLFRGYSCAACMDSFTNRKVLERHVQERHGAQYLQYSTLIRCMSCNSNFLNTDLLYQHIVSDHTHDFRLLDVPQRPKAQSVQQTEGSGKPHYDNHNFEKDDGSQKFTCRLCGLRFDLLPDLGRHHQVAHMNPSTVGHIPPGRGKYQLNRGRHYYSAFKKSLRPSSTLKKSSGSGIEKSFKFPSPGLSMVTSQIVESEAASLGKLLDYQCSDVAQTLFSKIQKTRPHPSNLDILSVARSVCCKTSLLAALEVKYGSLPENIFVKAAKLCSDIGIQIDWHQEGFLCPLGCKSRSNSNGLHPIQPIAVDFYKDPSVIDPINDHEMWGMEEYHYVLDSMHFGWKLKNEKVVICKDVSFGREKVPIVCAIDVNAKDSLCMKPEELLPHGNSVPWQGFHYITERLVDSSLVDSENSMPGCACLYSQCSPEKCDHVNHFGSVYENLVDIHGEPMHGRFAYDEDSKIILQEGYPIYECNSSCNCDTSCQNKVLQKGLLVNLELFRTENKGWAIRAAEPIPQGTFVCEYIGEVVKCDEAMRNAEREAKIGCSYLFDISSQIDRERVQNVGTAAYMIDATRYGNVSRFINHSCSPNLDTRLVLVESKDCQLAHIGLFANQDISTGEELAYDYRQELVAEDGWPCHCGAMNCRGRVY